MFSLLKGHDTNTSKAPSRKSVIAMESTLKGLRKLILNEKAIAADLDNTWAVVAEAIQTILRREDCGCISVHYNSCRDRCCPMCQEFPKEKWVDARREDILDAPYFHVVFTVPEELNPIIYSNQKFLYTALYHAASDTLSELAADSKYLGTDIGYICILHTWGSTMNFHPHIHAIVLGGGLDVKNHWKDNGKEFFLPIKVISKTFRGKYMAERYRKSRFSLVVTFTVTSLSFSTYRSGAMEGILVFRKP